MDLALRTERAGTAHRVDIIVKDQGILGGIPVFRGTRVPFQALLDYLEGAQTLADPLPSTGPNVG